MAIQDVPHEHVEVLPFGGFEALRRGVAQRLQAPRRRARALDAVRLGGLGQGPPAAAAEVQAEPLEHVGRARVLGDEVAERLLGEMRREHWIRHASPSAPESRRQDPD